jgi:hypothetical protein
MKSVRDAYLRGIPRLNSFLQHYLLKNGMIVWRDHDHMHGMRPDFTVVGELRTVGIKCGEQQKADGGFDNVEYVMDAASLGMAKGVIMLGHVVSEQAGMEDYATWLKTFVHDVPIQFAPAEEPFW